MPYLTAASCPALQCVRIPSPGRRSLSPFSPILRQDAISLSLISTASFFIFSIASGMFGDSSAVFSILSSAQKRLTAVGREEPRYFFASFNLAMNMSWLISGVLFTISFAAR